MTRLALASLLALAAAAPAQDDASFRLTFDWAAPSSARVTERRVKKGQEAEMTYVLRIAADEAGTGRIVSFEDFAFKTINGMDATRPELQRPVAQALAMARHIPTVHADLRGDFVEFVGFDEMLDAMARSFVEIEGFDESKMTEMRRMLDQPKVRGLLVAKGQETWNVWVGTWNDLSFRTGEPSVVEGEFALPGSEVTLPLRVEATCKGIEVVDGRRRARVSIADTMTAEGESLNRYLREILVATGAESAPPDLARFQRKTTIEGVFEIETLRPIEIDFRQTLEGGRADGSTPLRQFDERSYRFEWE